MAIFISIYALVGVGVMIGEFTYWHDKDKEKYMLFGIMCGTCWLILVPSLIVMVLEKYIEDN